MTLRTLAWGMLGLGVLGGGALGCASRPSAAPVAPAPAQPTEEVAPAQPQALTADEVFVRDGLKKHANKLAKEIGERNVLKSWELADSTDYLASELEALGYFVERQGYELGQVAAQNLSVTVRGGQRGDQIFMVGAHYDSPTAGSGFESALSAAAVLELARMMRGATLERTLKLVFFASGESPEADGDARGARHFARKVHADARRAAEPGLPEAVQKASEVENFGILTIESLLDLGVVEENGLARVRVPIGSNRSGWEIESVIARAFNDEGMKLSSVPLQTRESDALSFSELGIPTVEIGAPRPSGVQEMAAISEEQLNLAAQVVMRIRHGLGDILVERATNDGMVTSGIE